MDVILLLFASFFTVIDLLLIIYFIKRQNPFFFISLHLLSFWAIIIFFNLVSITRNDFGYNIFEFFLVNTLIIIYIISFISMYLNYKGKFLDNKSIIEYIIKIDHKTISLLLSAWVVFKFYLIFKYGIYSFFLLSFREEMQIPYWEVSLNSLLLYPALGAFFSLLAKAIHNVKIIFNPFTIIPFIFFFIFSVIFNELGSARRLVIFMGFWMILIYLTKTKLKLNIRLIFLSILFVILSFAFAEYFQSIRDNILDPNIQSLLYSNEPSDVLLGIRLTLTEQSKYYSSVTANLNERFSPFSVLYEINHIQFTNFTFTYGRLLLQAVENVLPAIIFPEKVYTNADAIICHTYQYPDIDLPSGVLVSMQSDFSIFGFFIAPLPYYLLFFFFNFMIKKYFSKSKLIVLTSFAMLILTAFYIESLIDSLLVIFRDFIIILFIYFLIMAFKRKAVNF